MGYVVTGIRPSGAVGLRLKCVTKGHAEAFADLWQHLHPDWVVSIHLQSESHRWIDRARWVVPRPR
jgi:hypothetical protein